MLKMGEWTRTHQIHSPHSAQKLQEMHGYCMSNREKYQYFHKKGTLKTEFSNFTVLVLNQSPINAVPLIVQCPRDQKTALMGDPLY